MSGYRSFLVSLNVVPLLVACQVRKMDDPSKYIIVRSNDNQVIARYAPASTGKSVLAQVIKKSESDGTLTKVGGLDVAGDAEERLEAGDYIFTPSAAGTQHICNNEPVDVLTCV